MTGRTEQPSPVDLTIVIVNFNTARLIGQLRTALDHARGSLELQFVLVDNASRDDSLAVLRSEFPDARLIVNDSNVGFGRANNQALPFVAGRYLLLLNTDAFVAPDTLRKTVDYMELHPDCGVLGARLKGRDGTLQPSCRYFPTPWNVFLHRTGLARLFPNQRLVDDMAWDHASTRECDWVPGCFYLIRREVIGQVGLFDPRYFLYYEEIDHCRAAKRAGWKVVFFGGTDVVHLGGESASSAGDLTAAGRQIPALQIESELLYFRKHFGLAGVMTSLLLSSLADTVVTLKVLVRAGRSGATRMPRSHFAMLWGLAVRTRLGSRPTR